MCTVGKMINLMLYFKGGKMPLVIDGNKEVTTPIKDIIMALQQHLSLIGVNKLKDVSFKQTNAIVTCPHHKNGCENTPACYVLLEDRDGLSAGTAHCFSCGWKANFVRFVAECMNSSYRTAIDWLLGFVNYVLVDTGETVDFSPMTLDIAKDGDEYVGWGNITSDELKKYDYIHPYMFQRKLTDEVISKFEVGYDPGSDCLTFPVYVDGRCVFVAKRKVSYKCFIMPEMNPKPIYGLDYITGNEVIVCESVINALTCFSYGREAIALFGTGSRWQINKLCNLPIRKFVLALDPDDAGRIGIDRMKNSLLKSGKMVSVLNIPDGKDVNDLSEEEFNSLTESYIF